MNYATNASIRQVKASKLRDFGVVGIVKACSEILDIMDSRACSRCQDHFEVFTLVKRASCHGFEPKFRLVLSIHQSRSAYFDVPKVSLEMLQPRHVAAMISSQLPHVVRKEILDSKAQRKPCEG